MRKIPFLLVACICFCPHPVHAQLTPQIGVNFASASFGPLGPALGQSGCIPPDTMGAIGRDHIVQLINGLYTVFDKRDGGMRVLESTTLDGFWVDAGVTPTASESGGCIAAVDPRVIYDPYEDRFYAISIDNVANPNSFLVAVSNTGNPEDGWTGFPVDSDTDNTRWADFPMLGMTREFVVVGAPTFRVQGFGGPAREATVVAIRKSDLLAPNPSVGVPIRKEEVESTTGPFPHPVVSLDNTSLPPTFLSAGNDNVRRSQLSGTTPTIQHVSTISLSADLDNAPDGLQPTPSQALDNIDTRFASSPVLQDGFFWGVQVVEHPQSGTSALRWVRINQQSNSVVDGLLASSTLDILYPSIAVNKLDDIAIGFTGTYTNFVPSALVAIGETDSSGTPFADDPTTLVGKLGKQGAEYEILDDQNRNRWGDYSATLVDPFHPLHFWTFQEFLLDDDQWGIQITQIKLTPDDVVGDMDFDGDLDLDDSEPFVLGIVNAQDYYDAYGAEGTLHGDIDEDEDLDLDDVKPYVILLTGPGQGSGATASRDMHHTRPAPEPSSIGLVAVAIFAFSLCIVRRHRLA